MKRDTIWLIIQLISANLIGLVIATNMTGGIRPFIVFWFALVCPGMAFVRLLDLDDLLVELTLASVLSLVIDMLVASYLLYAESWTTVGIMSVLLSICLTGLTAQTVAWLSRRAPKRVRVRA